MKKRVFTILVVLMLFGVSPVWADTVWTEGHHEIFDGDVYGEIWMYNDCTLDIFGGDIFRLAAFDTTYTNWHDGEMNTLWARDDSIVSIYGGTLDTLAASENSLVNLCAYDVVITHTGGFWHDGQISGKYYLNDESFIFDLWGENTYLHVNTVPEPASLLLLSLGSLLLRRKW